MHIKKNGPEGPFFCSCNEPASDQNSCENVMPMLRGWVYTV